MELIERFMKETDRRFTEMAEAHKEQRTEIKIMRVEMHEGFKQAFGFKMKIIGIAIGAGAVAGWVGALVAIAIEVAKR